jgi:hypothetical protein
LGLATNCGQVVEVDVLSERGFDFQILMVALYLALKRRQRLVEFLEASGSLNSVGEDFEDVGRCHG